MSSNPPAIWQLLTSVPEPVQRPVEDPWGYRIDGIELGRGGAPLLTLLMTESAALYEVRNTD